MALPPTRPAHGPATPKPSGRYCASRPGARYSRWRRTLAARSSRWPRALRSAAQGARGEGRVGFPGPARGRWQGPKNTASVSERSERSKGRKGAQRHDTHPLSDLSDLSDVGAPEKSSGLTRHRWMSRPPVFVVTSFSQPARTRPSSRPRVCSASSRRPSASRRMSNSDTSGFRFVRIQHSARRALVCFSVSPICRSAARLCGQK